MKSVAVVGARAEAGHAQVQHYTPNRSEEFGLNKRTRRLKRGDRDVTEPNGKLIPNGGK
jgi:hypothetical protein